MIIQFSHKIVYLLFGCILFQLSLYAQKNDTVYLLNGDRVTGEIKKFEYGILYLKTDAMQTVNIEYDQINSLYTSKYLEIRSSTGYRYYGSITKSGLTGFVNIIQKKDTIPKPILDIVELNTLNNKFFKRMDGSVDIGLNFTKASNVLQFNLSSDVSYRTVKNLTELTLSSIITDQQNSDVTRKNDAGINFSKFLKGPWFVGFQVGGEQNTELNLDFRIQTGSGVGYDIIRTNSNRFYGITGLLGNTEKTIDTKTKSYNLEGLIALQYKWFWYRSPKIDFNTGVSYFPSFTVRERHRINFNVKGKFEIVKDLYFSVNFYDNFDNKPSDVDENSSITNDWGIITSVGYSF